jgi:hypothetical protein
MGTALSNANRSIARVRLVGNVLLNVSLSTARALLVGNVPSTVKVRHVVIRMGKGRENDRRSKMQVVGPVKPAK